MPAAHKDPAKGWELLRAPALTSHPDRLRLLCRVCWVALERGMAEQVTPSVCKGASFWNTRLLQLSRHKYFYICVYEHQERDAFIQNIIFLELRCGAGRPLLECHCRNKNMRSV